jgi:hypothetical protein
MKREEMQTCVTTKKDLEDTVFKEMSRHGRTHTAERHTQEVASGIIRSTDRGSRVGDARSGGGGGERKGVGVEWGR